MSVNLIFNVNLDVLLKKSLTINQYFMIQMINFGSSDLFKEYLGVFHKSPIDKTDLEYLIKNEILELKDKNTKPYFDNLKVSDKFTKEVFIDKDTAIEELSNTYPKLTPLKKRRLQGDKEKWSKKYLSIIKNDRCFHERILKCIELEHKHRKNTDSEEFWSMMTTYVNNKRWELYMEEVENGKIKEEVTNSYEL